MPVNALTKELLTRPASAGSGGLDIIKALSSVPGYVDPLTLTGKARDWLIAKQNLWAALGHNDPRTDGVHPSGYYDGCGRAHFYECVSADKNPVPDIGEEPRLRMIFDVGHWYHFYMQVWLLEAGVLIQPEVELGINLFGVPLTGKADGLLGLSDGNWWLEIKTVNPFGFEKVKKSNYPSEPYAWQATLYLIMAHYLGIPVRGTRFLFINKGSSELLEFPFMPDERMGDKVQDSLYQLGTLVSAGTPPPRKCGSSLEPDAQACPFSTVCFKR